MEILVNVTGGHWDVVVARYEQVRTSHIAYTDTIPTKSLVLLTENNLTWCGAYESRAVQCFDSIDQYGQRWDTRKPCTLPHCVSGALLLQS
jgi:hypothetical protein